MQFIPWGSNSLIVITGSGHGLAPDKWQAITWTNIARDPETQMSYAIINTLRPSDKYMRQ